MDEVDDDGSGAIEFPEFLHIIKGSGSGMGKSQITQFFKDMTTGKYGNVEHSFDLFVASQKRKFLKQSIYSLDEAEREEGRRIRDNCKRELLGDKGSGSGLTSLMASMNLEFKSKK